MSSVSSTRSNDSYEAEWASVQDKHERALDKMKSDEEQELAKTKEEYQTRLKELKEEANAEVRKLKEDSYDSQGRRFTNIERENLEEKRRLTDSYEAALGKARKSHIEQEKSYEGKLDNALSEANEHTRSQVQTQKSEFVKLAEGKRQEAEQAKRHYENELARERLKGEKSAELMVKENDFAREKAIVERSAVYEGYIAENRKNTNAALAEKDKALYEQKFTTDPDKISPEAKKKIEETYQNRFNKEIHEERRVNAANVEALKTRNQNYEESVRENYSSKFNDMSKDLRERNMVEKQQLVRGYQDLETQSDSTQKRLMDRQADQAQRSYMKHAGEMSLQEERNQERLKEQRASLLDDKFKEKDDLENKQRAQEREWGYKLTDTRREYEKKILDQKENHEKELGQVKFEFDKKLQEQQRTAKRLLDDRVRAYEAQLKAQESMHKEHDRLLTEHFEEELDSMKRTNARISQAKS